MAKTYHLQLLRGDTSKVSKYTGLSGELVFNRQLKNLWIHDGTTVGGIAVAMHKDIPTKVSQLDNDLNFITNSAGIIKYCSCTTAAGTVAKTGTVSNYKLTAGATVIVDFVNGNTATNPTLNINNTGAKAIKSAGAAIGKLGTNTCLMFVYTGSEYHAVGVPTNTPSFTGTLTIN